MNNSQISQYYTAQQVTSNLQIFEFKQKEIVIRQLDMKPSWMSLPFLTIIFDEGVTLTFDLLTFCPNLQNLQ